MALLVGGGAFRRLPKNKMRIDVKTLRKYIKYFLKSSKGNFLLILGELFAEQLAALKKCLFERSKETNFIYFLPGSSPSRSRVIRSGDGVSKEKLIYLEI